MKYENDVKEVDLNELLEYARIPEINAYFADVLEKRTTDSKGLRQDLAVYRKAKEKRYKEFFLPNYQEGMEPGLYWFELTKYREDDWRYYHIFPTPHDNISAYEILPKDIMQYIGETPAIEEEVLTYTGLWSESCLKYVDVTFVHYSPTYIMGTVRENIELEPKHKPEKKEKRTEKRTIQLEEDPGLAFSMMFNQLLSKPEPVLAFINDYLEKNPMESAND